MAVASCSLAASMMCRGDLLAEVDDRVAVVGQDRVDQRLADVVHVAEDRGHHDGALACSPRSGRGSSRAARPRCFMTSRDCRTKGRISSPAPNCSPTSFMAGRRTSFRVDSSDNALGETARYWAIMENAFAI